MTFEEICRKDSRIREIYRAVRMIQGGDNFCANSVFFTLVKPLLRQFVGWGRMVNPDHDAAEIKMEGVDDEDNTPNMMIHDPGPLGTSEAYDVAYQAIYNALPDCSNNCGCY